MTEIEKIMPIAQPTPMTLMQRALVSGASIEVIERLSALQKEWEDRQALGAFNEALSAAQAEMTSIANDSFNPQTRSRYASFDAINRKVRPIYTKHGLSISFDEAEESPTGHVRVYAYVGRGVFTRRYHYDSPITTTGLQGKAMMTPTHGKASAVSYAKRYLVGMIFNLSTGNEVDDDGNAAGNGEEAEPITSEQLTELQDLIKETGRSTEKVCQACHVETLEQLNSKQFAQAKAKLESYRRAF